MDRKLQLLAVFNFVVFAHCVDLTGKIYQTNAALKEENLMFCYECNTMVNGKSCSNFTDKEDLTKFSTKCTGDNKTCMVKRYSYTTSNESATSAQQLWSLERNCSRKCEDGCIVIGERIKIYACQACCETPLCNVSNASGTLSSAAAAVCVAVLFLLLRSTAVAGPPQPAVIPSSSSSSFSSSSPSPNWTDDRSATTFTATHTSRYDIYYGRHDRLRT
ncbi:Hypothetical protein CINCED_3A012661 [Cinara cedri]|nr:Hypothetical protein CINCED_3A012661 [Cinara cedri]